MFRRTRNLRRLAHRRKLREKGIGIRVRGSRSSRRAWKFGPCHFDCLCDFHEGITDRKKSRAVAKRAAMNEIKEQLQ